MIVLPHRRKAFRPQSGGLSAAPQHYWDLESHADLTDKIGDWDFGNANGLSTSVGGGPGGRDALLFDALYDNCSTAEAKSSFGLEQSLSLWVYFQSTNPVNFYGAYYFWWADGGADIIQRAYLISDSYNPYMGNYVNMGNASLTHAHGSYSAGNWYHLVAATDAEGASTLFVNSVEVSTGTTTSVASAERISLGLPWYLTGTWFRYQFYGRLALLGLWDVCLNENDVSYLYNGGDGRAAAEL